MKAHRSRVVGLLVALLLAAGACSSSGSKPKANGPTHSGGTLRLAVVGLDSLDPGQVVPTNQSDMVALTLLDRGLTTIDDSGQKAVPALATSWSNNGSGGLVGRTWTFHLDPHARFANGAAVTPHDVVYSLSRVALTGNTTLAGARLDVIDGYGAYVARRSAALSGLRTGSGTVIITTAAPDAELPDLLASPLYSVIDASEASEPAPTVPKGQLPPLVSPNIVGAGPFEVASDKGGTLTLRRTATSTAQLDEVQLIREVDATSAVEAVRSGKADWAAVAPAQKGDATGGDIDHLNSSPLGAEEFFGINLSSPNFASPLFRQAIVKAVDRASIVAKVLPGLIASNGVVPKGVPGAVADPCGAACRYDPAAAEVLLKRAFPGGRIPVVEIDTDADQDDVALANSVAYYLGAVGIHVVVKPHLFVSYQSFITTGKQQLFRTGWVGLWPSAGAYLEPLFRSTSLDNSTAYKSTKVDGQLDLALATADVSTREQIYANLQRTIMADDVILPMASYEQVEALSNRVQNYSPRLDGTFDVDTVAVTPGS